MQPDRAQPWSRLASSDVIIPALLFALTTTYVALQPRNLSPADESIYLYEAKRVLAGEVLYRDVFDIVTPGWLYLMAGLFRVFGVDLATARVSMAALHGATAVLIYFTCRRLGIRAGLGWLPAAAYLLACQSAWPIASQHWLGTLLTVLLLCVCAGLPGPRVRWALWPGIVIGLLIAVHQQRGVMVGAGVVVWLVVDRLLQPRVAASRGPPLAGQLAWLAAGTAIIVIPMLVFAVATAGFAAVWQALVIHPLVNYRSLNHCSWGHIDGVTAEQGSYTFPRLLKFLPIIVLVDAVRLAFVAWRGAERVEARRLAFLICSAMASMASIAYYPDFIHIAFIAPVLFVAVAETLERAVGGALDRSAPARAAGWAVAAAAIVAGGIRLEHNLVRGRATFSLIRHTAFGRVDFANPIEARLYDKLAELMRDVPSRQLFCYPVISHFYLMVDADNPTPFQFLLPGYSTPAQLQQVVKVLQERKLPYIVAFPTFVPPDDPIIAYLHRDYEPMTEAGDVGQAIFRRKPGAG